MSKTKIEWTDITWNPVRGCTKISPGCKHCYAATFAERFRGVKGHPYEHGFDLKLVDHKLLEPFEWSKPAMVFVNSMSDLFQPGVPDDYIFDVVTVMLHADWHVYQILTKRSERLMQMLNGPLRSAAKSQHIWWGVSVEDVKFGKPRIEHLKNTPAKIKFLSVEPLLENLGDVDFSQIDWVIVGGESGPGARAMRESWVLSILKQCKEEHIPFFFKQWGGVQKKKAGRRLQGKIYNEFPSVVTKCIPKRDKRVILGNQVSDNLKFRYEITQAKEQIQLPPQRGVSSFPRDTSD